MTDAVILGVIAAGQVIFFVLLVLLLFTNRARRLRRAARAAGATRALAEPIQRWSLGLGDVADVRMVLGRLSADEALDQVTLAAAAKLTSEQLGELAPTLRDEPWVARVLTRASSRWWWRRLDAARLLNVVGGKADGPLLQRLLADEHAAVQAAATACLPRLGDAALVGDILDGLPWRSEVVRILQISALGQMAATTVPALLERFVAVAPLARLAAWIDLAESLGDPRCLPALVALSHHPVAQVRISTARALRRYFHPDAEATLKEMIADDDWRVRVQAARALGAIGAASAIPALMIAIGDRSWWVRFRSALALAQIGEAGRHALRQVRELPDRYAADMAALVSGLSDGAVTDLSEA